MLSIAPSGHSRAPSALFPSPSASLSFPGPRPAPIMSEHAQLQSICAGLLSLSIAKESKDTTSYAGFTLREWTQLDVRGVSRLHHAAQKSPTKLIGFVETFGLGDDSLGALWCIEGQAMQVAAVLDYSVHNEEDVVRQGADAHRLGQYRRVLAFIDAANIVQAKAFCKSHGNAYWEEEGTAEELK
jgi:hypothetical protein